MINYLKVEYLFFYKHNVYKQIQAQICWNVTSVTQPDLLLNRYQETLHRMLRDFLKN